MTKQLILGNWKMHGSRQLLERFHSFLTDAGNADLSGMGLSVPFTLIADTRKLFGNTGLLTGAQDVSEHQSGAFTGCVSADMLAEIGCDFCLVGHSERRQYYNETNEQTANKTEQLNRVGITPVLCVGENLEQRQNDQTVETVRAQLAPCIDALTKAREPVIAYEPVWAIGTGKTATNEQAQQVHRAIRDYLGSFGLGGLPLLYGGSVKPENAAGLLEQRDIDGTLVGGASLEPESLYAITGR